MRTIGFVGGGKMAEALISGLLSGPPGPEQVIVCEPLVDRVEYLVGKYPIAAVELGELAAQADVVVLAVKPQVVNEVLSALAGALGPDQVVVSIAAGVPTSRIERALPGVPVVRVMPNTPALVGQGAAAIAPGTHATDAHLQLAQEILQSTGIVVRVPEDRLDAVTAVSGSGPAYFFLLAQLLQEAAVLVGLSVEQARELVVQTAFGAAAMLRDSGDDAATLRSAVTSPGGTTAAALEVFDDAGLAQIVQQAVLAARDRSTVLGSD
ncbi:MAG: pyrroline-5-carboxylate reductase [Antricoccus sp.]